MMPNPRVEYDDRQHSPAWFARELGWARVAPGWSWATLLDLAEQRYYLNRAQQREGAT